MFLFHNIQYSCALLIMQYTRTLQNTRVTEYTLVLYVECRMHTYVKE